MTKAPTKKAAPEEGVKAATPSKAAAGSPSIRRSAGRAITRSGRAAAAEVRAVRAIMASLEVTIPALVHKKGLGSFTPPGLLKGRRYQRAREKKRKGIDRSPSKSASLPLERRLSRSRRAPEEAEGRGSLIDETGVSTFIPLPGLGHSRCCPAG